MGNRPPRPRSAPSLSESAPAVAPPQRGGTRAVCHRRRTFATCRPKNRSRFSLLSGLALNTLSPIERRQVTRSSESPTERWRLHSLRSTPSMKEWNEELRDAVPGQRSLMSSRPRFVAAGSGGQSRPRPRSPDGGTTGGTGCPGECRFSLALPVTSLPLRRRALGGGSRTHNAGVAGSSPAPAIHCGGRWGGEGGRPRKFGGECAHL